MKVKIVFRIRLEINPNFYIAIAKWVDNVRSAIRALVPVDA